MSSAFMDRFALGDVADEPLLSSIQKKMLKENIGKIQMQNASFMMDDFNDTNKYNNDDDDDDFEVDSFADNEQNCNAEVDEDEDEDEDEGEFDDEEGGNISVNKNMMSYLLDDHPSQEEENNDENKSNSNHHLPSPNRGFSGNNHHSMNLSTIDTNESYAFQQHQQQQHQQQQQQQQPKPMTVSSLHNLAPGSNF